MKFTAWPLALLALFAARDSEGRRAPLRMLAGILVVVVPLVLHLRGLGPSHLRGQRGVLPAGALGRRLAGGLGAAGAPLRQPLPGAPPRLHDRRRVARRRWRWRSTCGGGPLRRRAKVCQVAGATLLVAIMLAPATRIGYLLYPLNLFVWSWMLTPRADRGAAHRSQAASGAPAGAAAGHPEDGVGLSFPLSRGEPDPPAFRRPAPGRARAPAARQPAQAAATGRRRPGRGGRVKRVDWLLPAPKVVGLIDHALLPVPAVGAGLLGQDLHALLASPGAARREDLPAVGLHLVGEEAVDGLL